MSFSKIETLPYEVVGLILSSLPNASCLYASVRTCQMLKQAFIAQETAICEAVMLTHIDEAMFHDVLAEADSKRLLRSGWTEEGFTSFMQKVSLQLASQGHDNCCFRRSK